MTPRETIIVEALKRELNPYYFETQKRIGAELGYSAYTVAKVAKDYSLILDRNMEERRNMSQPKEPTTDHNLELAMQLAALRDDEHARTRFDWLEQEFKEARMMDAALETVRKVTPELLKRVGTGLHPSK
jgi:hypothetical protein